MVVTSGTQHLIRTSKNMTVSKKISFATLSPSFVYRNYFNYTKNVPSVFQKIDSLVRLCCTCRRFHSTDYFQTSRESRAALSPQEILLVNVDAVISLGALSPLERIHQSLLSENPEQQLGNLISQDLSRASVHTYVKSLIPQSIKSVQQSSASEDLLDVFVRKYAGDQRILDAAVNNDVQSILDVLNNDTGAPILVISNISIVVDVNILKELVSGITSDYIRELYPDNVYAQIIANQLAQEHIELLSRNLKLLLKDKGIPIDSANKIISLLRRPGRGKRDLVSDLLQFLLREQIKASLTPIRNQFNNAVNNITSSLLVLYSPSLPSSPLLAFLTDIANVIVIRTAEVIVDLQTNINSVFDNLINGPNVTTARRRRDASLEIDNFYNLENVALEMYHKRAVRATPPNIFDIINTISSIISFFLSNNLNVVVKKIVLALISSQYTTIGSIVTLPLRIAINNLIDSILPCTGCPSII